MKRVPTLNLEWFTAGFRQQTTPGRRWAALACAVAVSVVLGGMGAPVAAEEEPVVARKVLLVSMPRLTWEDLAEHEPPALLGLLRRSSVASLSTRTIGPETTTGEGYATVGAGARTAVPELDSGFALQADETFEGDPAAAVYERRTGRPARGAVLQLNIAPILQLNHGLLYGAQPGALGEALRTAGKTAAVIGNADGSEDFDLPILPKFEGPDDLPLRREAALAVIDATGQAGGVVDRSVTTHDPTAPFGLRLNEAAVAAAFANAWDDYDVVLLENSDLERADAYTIFSTAEASYDARAEAIARGDDILEDALEYVDLTRDLVIVFAPAGPRQREQLTIAAIAGAGIEPGVARSGTTRRNGYLTLPDIAPTVLGRLGVAIPDTMTGTAVSPVAGKPVDLARIDAFVESNEVAIFRDTAVGFVTVSFIVFQVLVYLAAALSIVFGWARVQRIVAFLALMILAVPPVAFGLGRVRSDLFGLGGYLAVLAGLAVVLAALARVVGRGDRIRPPVLIIALTLALLIADLFTGARMQINTVFGYSPIVAGRFAGYGNLASALVAISSVITATSLVAWPGAADRSRRTVSAVAAAMFLFVLIVVGHPALGADVGGVLTLVPVAATVVLLLTGRRLGWRRVALIGIATVAALAVFAAIDMSRPPELRTHLGRLVARTFGSGGADLVAVLQRKALANLSILTSSTWTYFIPAALAFLAFLIWRRPKGILQRLQDRTPGLRTGLIGALVAAVLGFALNDSGVAIPAMMLAVLLPYLTYLVMRTPDVHGP